MMIKREIYLEKIRNFYDSELIKVIMGIRRCGKSVLLMQIIEELKEKGIKEDHIIYINFEDYDFIEYTDPKKFNELIKSKIKDEKKYYLFFDEIQSVIDFEKVVNSFRATMNVSIFITGSNSKLLSGEFATYLTGRIISIKMMPFTYSEFLELKKSKHEEINEKTFSEYVEWGGMPLIYNTNNEIERKMYLRDLYSAIILKDIVERRKIKDINLLNKIVQFMMENIGGIISSNSIAGYLKNDKVNTTVDTVMNYVEYITSSSIFSKVNRYDIRGKNVMATLEKYYVTDLGLLNLKKSPIEKKIGGRLENIVYNELISRGYEVYIGKTDKGEIDFVIDKFGERIYIQVADYLSSDEVMKREFGAFNDVNDNFPKYVITMDKIDYSQNGIIHLNIEDFLLNKKI
ncbi:MAG TPA: ATP-binding protein [Clostridiaceae bacterium]|nr:ATP-binding protein [Clostridiaceae bacterium]